MYSEPCFALQHDGFAESASRSEVCRADEKDTLVIIRVREEPLELCCLSVAGSRIPNAHYCIMQTAI
jgi:hypothetical protein